ncbi:MAG: site-specific integrase [Thermoanaerobaculia bacterium]|nr:site-specific integrase [Thermoanaerobaculia bacterium]
MPTVKLTKRAVDAAKPPAGASDVYWWDTEVKGFGLRVTPAGRKTWFIQYRNLTGQVRRLKLGNEGTLTPDEARARARRELGRVADGEDPTAERMQMRGRVTVAEIAERYLTEYGPAALKSSTLRSHRNMLANVILPAFGRRPIAALDRESLRAFYAKRARRTPTHARRLLEVVHRLFALAQEWGAVPEAVANPAAWERGELPKRERYLSGAELARIGAYLRAGEAGGTVSPSVALAIRLLLLTGCRAGEILSLRWEYVDLARGLLLLPDTKTGQSTRQLAAPALALLSRAQRHAENPFVVVGAVEGTSLHYRTLHGAWRRLCSELGLRDVRIHDLRHSFASVAVGQSLGLPIIGRLLGHKSPKTTARYSHVGDDPARAAAERVAGEISANLEGQSPAEVVRIRR